MTSAREVRSEERQDDEAEVPCQPRRFVVRESGSEASNLDRDSRRRRKGEGLEPAARRTHRIVVGREDELFPQPAAVLACELTGEGVEVAHPFHGDQEPLVGCEAGCPQLGDLVTEVILQLVDVMAVYCRRACDVCPPFGDL